MIKLPTSHSWWIFDEKNLRYRRIPRDLDPDGFALEHDWEKYFSLEVDPDYSAFTVFLNEERTRLMRGYIEEEDKEEFSKELSEINV